MQDDGEFSAHHDGMSYRSPLPPIPHLANEGRTTCVVKTRKIWKLIKKIYACLIFYFRPDSSMDMSKNCF